ncbi:hypothetical protein GBAR_LOCUS29492 [Geodia barretti]|uniref:Uncharacterized protein n=1 Tax=Geodia barretti TaxID=519541 RepID=A0AA35XK33_GEOBA|nr:hypothetical protein GBAR_LOCUS29492 [Geodia barretti]
MKAVSFLLLSVAWSLGEVQSQVFPYISFMGQTLANNSYVDLKFVGNDSNGFNNLQCRTDLATCCSNSQGSHRGDWYYPNGSRLQFQGGFFEGRKDQVVLLKKENGNEMPSGIYRCDIPSVASHNVNNDEREPVYAGLYSSGGGLSVVGDVDYSYTEGPYQVNLTTKTVGGPPTIVFWTKNCARAVGDTTAFLSNTEKSEFTHILTIYPAETKGSFFIFTASNNKPSGDSVIFPETTKNVSVPYVMIHAVNATSVRLKWAGRRFFSTSVKYTSIFSNTGLAISHYKAVLPPYVDATDISLDDYHPGYEHHFTLSYVICNVVPAYHQATATFAFDTKHFQVQFGTMEHCLNWGVSL